MVGSLERYTKRHIDQAIKPESLMPKTWATAEPRPREASWPRPPNLKGRLGLSVIVARIFQAAKRACRMAYWAVGGQRPPVVTSGTEALSPSAKTPGQSGTSR